MAITFPQTEGFTLSLSHSQNLLWPLGHLSHHAGFLSMLLLLCFTRSLPHLSHSMKKYLRLFPMPSKYWTGPNTPA